MFRTFSVSLLLAALSAGAGATEPKTVVLDVPGMNCALCPISVKKALERVPGVRLAIASLEKKSAEATYDPDRTTAEALATAVTKAGYPATVRKP
jgi:mercuric ion binding protein